jgi:hypothetical protein
MLTCSDYAVMVENVPGNATNKDEWMEFFNKLTPIHEHGGKVATLAIALNNGNLLAMSEARTKKEDEISILRAKLCREKYEDIQKKVKSEEEKLYKMRTKMGKMRARVDFKAVALFVTFESESTRVEIEDEFKGLIARKGTLFRKKYRLKVRRAPDPDMILWENLQNRGLEAWIRVTVVYFIGIVILAVSFGLIVGIMSAKNQLSIEGYPSYCIDAVDSNHPNAKESIMWLRYSHGQSVFQAYLKCYCDSCSVGCGSKAIEEESFCSEWGANERNLLALTVLGAGTRTHTQRERERERERKRERESARAIHELVDTLMFALAHARTHTRVLADTAWLSCAGGNQSIVECRTQGHRLLRKTPHNKQARRLALCKYFCSLIHEHGVHCVGCQRRRNLLHRPTQIPREKWSSPPHRRIP